MRDRSDRSLSKEELRNEVVHRSNCGESKRRISIQLGVSRWKVADILRRHRENREAPKPNEPMPPDVPSQVASHQDTIHQDMIHQDTIPQSLGLPMEKRASKLDKFEPQILQLMDRYPSITVIRLQEELQSAVMALLDRVSDNAIVYRFEGKSYRKNRTKQAQ